MWILNNGVATPEGDVVIVDQDKLCYLVKNISHSASGLRTISKALVEEFVIYLDGHREATAIQVKDALVGKSSIDKFEYGYNATLVKMARLILEHSDDPKYVSFVNNTSFANISASPVPLQQIYYGAPGTGKSYTINAITKKEKANTIRTTFHPDTDYASFVGAYKPTTKEVELRDLSGHKVVENGKVLTEERISYEFVSQSFLKAYVKAWKLYAAANQADEVERQYLVIEEINRGNCAQIFGDLFQLLDRNGSGFSDYPIEADADMQKQLRKKFEGLELPLHDEINALYGDEGRDIVGEVLNGDILLLPNNLYIWATMNTSDQSLFPIDSAFKRRWDWKYMPISDAGEGWTIELKHSRYDWWEFLEAINLLIGKTTFSEDKKLGYFFCKAKDGVISADMFVGKVIFYLWNDVFKDYGFENEAFVDADDEDENKLTFQKFYLADGHRNATVNEEKVEMFLNNLGLEPIEEIDDEEEDDEDEQEEEGNVSHGGLKVILNGNTIQEKNSISTFVKVIEMIGVERVAALDITISSYKLLSKKKLSYSTPGGYGHGIRKLGDYWMITKYANNAKLKCLYDIKEALNLDLEATIE